MCIEARKLERDSVEEKRSLKGKRCGGFESGRAETGDARVQPRMWASEGQPKTSMFGNAIKKPIL